MACVSLLAGKPGIFNHMSIPLVFVVFVFSYFISGRAPFLMLKLGARSMMFSEFEKLVKFLEAQVSGCVHVLYFI